MHLAAEERLLNRIRLTILQHANKFNLVQQLSDSEQLFAPRFSAPQQQTGPSGGLLGGQGSPGPHPPCQQPDACDLLKAALGGQAMKHVRLPSLCQKQLQRAAMAARPRPCGGLQASVALHPSHHEELA